LSEAVLTDVQFIALDYIPMGVLVLKDDFTVLFWNRQLEQWTGVYRNSVVGSSIFEPFPHLLEPRYSERLDSVFAGGPPVVFSSRVHKYLIPAPTRTGEPRLQNAMVTPLHPSSPESETLALVTIEDVTELTAKIQENRSLKGMLPICSHCKRIRDEQGDWNQLESYITERSDAVFSHSICEPCSRQFYPDIYT
jgi:PAS domain S-box-containing protein